MRPLRSRFTAKLSQSCGISFSVTDVLVGTVRVFQRWFGYCQDFLFTFPMHTGRLQPLMASAGRCVPETHFSIRVIIGTEGTGRRRCGKWHIKFDLLYLISLEIFPIFSNSTKLPKAILIIKLQYNEIC